MGPKHGTVQQVICSSSSNSKEEPVDRATRKKAQSRNVLWQTHSLNWQPADSLGQEMWFAAAGFWTQMATLYILWRCDPRKACNNPADVYRSVSALGGVRVASRYSETRWLVILAEQSRVVRYASCHTSETGFGGAAPATFCPSNSPAGDMQQQQQGSTSK